MKSDIYISIVIPVFNAERYLCECLDSILKEQNGFNEFELILVDDGSTDNSGFICDAYAESEKVKVFHVNNGGSACARNIGLRKAVGKYIWFVDADDYIAKDCLSYIVKKIKSQLEPEIIFLNGVKHYPDGRDIVIEEDWDDSLFQKVDSKGFIKYLATRNKFQASPCLKILKRSFLADNKICFEEGKRVEDLDWSLKCFLSAETFGCYNEICYYYRQAIATSNSARFQDNSYRDFKAVITKWIEIANKPEFEIISNDILSLTCYEYVMLLVCCRDYVKSDLKWHKEMQKLFNYRNDKKTKLVGICTKIFGIENTSKMLHAYLRVR